MMQIKLIMGGIATWCISSAVVLMYSVGSQHLLPLAAVENPTVAVLMIYFPFLIPHLKDYINNVRPAIVESHDSAAVRRKDLSFLLFATEELPFMILAMYLIRWICLASEAILPSSDHHISRLTLEAVMIPPIAIGTTVTAVKLCQKAVLAISEFPKAKEASKVEEIPQLEDQAVKSAK